MRLGATRGEGPPLAGQGLSGPLEPGALLGPVLQLSRS